MHLGSSLSLSCHFHGNPRVCGLFTLILLFYFLLYLPPLFLFLNYLKSVVNLHNSGNESMDSTVEFYLSTKKDGDKSAAAILKDARQSGCVFSGHRAAGIFTDFTEKHKSSGSIRRVHVTKATQRHANIRESKGPSPNKIQVKLLHQRSPYAWTKLFSHQQTNGVSQRHP